MPGIARCFMKMLNPFKDGKKKEKKEVKGTEGETAMELEWLNF